MLSLPIVFGSYRETPDKVLEHNPTCPAKVLELVLTIPRSACMDLEKRFLFMLKVLILPTNEHQDQWPRTNLSPHERLRISFIACIRLSRYLLYA